MNQVENKIPYGLLTEDEQKQFCLDAKQRGMYECYWSDEWVVIWKDRDFLKDYAYRLKMVPDEIYYCETTEDDEAVIFEYRQPRDPFGYLTTYSRLLFNSASDVNSYFCQDHHIKTLMPANAEDREQFNKAFEPEKKPDAANKPGPTETELQQKPNIPILCKDPVISKKCPKCSATMFIDTTGNWCCSFVGDQRQGIPGCDYTEDLKLKKGKWTLWQKDCGKKKPKKGTYKDLRIWIVQPTGGYWKEKNDGDFECANFYRYKKVRK